jgi:hypothetical protein
MQLSALDGSIAVSDHTYGTGTSWGAIFAGATAAAALSFILLVLGVGLGLSTISPYAYHDAPLAAATIGWIAFTQLAASGIGGYMAGRLRNKWSNIHTDEVHVRDTAHGLLAWAVATLVTVAVLAGGARAALSGAIDAGNAAATAVKDAGPSWQSLDYYAGMVLRSNGTAATIDAERAEVATIVATAMARGSLNNGDRSYLGQLIAKRNGLDQAEAERRVDAIYADARKTVADAAAKAKATADEARKAGAKASLWMFVALLLGAFTATLAATFGGRNRDDERVIMRPAT